MKAHPDNLLVLSKAFRQAGEILITRWEEMRRYAAEKTGSGGVLRADIAAERIIVPVMAQLWPTFPVLCEEVEFSQVADLVDVTFLPVDDNNTNLPPELISVDGLDGSALYEVGELSLTAISGAVIHDGHPAVGLVYLPVEQTLFFTDGIQSLENGENIQSLQKMPLAQSLIGLDDCKSVSNEFREQICNPLSAREGGFRYRLNVPAVIGGIKVLRGTLAAYVTNNARHWDVAATAALCTATGMVVRCLDGTDVPWNQVRIPPVVFARDEEIFEHIYQVCTFKR